MLAPPSNFEKKDPLNSTTVPASRTSYVKSSLVPSVDKKKLRNSRKLQKTNQTAPIDEDEETPKSMRYTNDIEQFSAYSQSK